MFLYVFFMKVGEVLGSVAGVNSLSYVWIPNILFWAHSNLSLLPCKKVNLKIMLLLHFIVFIWGFTAILGALITIDAIPLVWYRMCIGSVVYCYLLSLEEESHLK